MDREALISLCNAVDRTFLSDRLPYPYTKTDGELELLRRNDWLYDPQAVAAAISLAIAFGTVLWQTLKAAKTNPAIELKKE